MATVDAFCAAVGGTILVCQFILSLIGFDQSHGSRGARSPGPMAYLAA